MIYGRRIGRRLKPNQQERLSKFFREFELHIEDQKILGLPTVGYKSLQMEIGFGTGDHLVMQATTHPDTLFIGCEPFLNGVAALALKAMENSVQNIRVFKEDAALLLKGMSDQSVNKIFLLFPDPWPKKRHHKRRFVCPENLDLIAKKLSLQGEFLIATDHEDYALWIEEHLMAHPRLELVEKTSAFPEHWVKTRFEEKADTQGRGPVFFKIISTVKNKISTCP